jgi:hypothetical protein
MITFEKLGQLGRMCNQFFQISAVVGLAKKNNDTILFPKWERSGLFKNLIPQINILPQIKHVYREQCFHYQDIPYQRNMSLEGFFQSYKYFDFCKQDILRYFDLKDEYRNYIVNKYNNVLDFNKTCSIGVRRGDYLQKSNFHTNLTINYYNKALEIINPETVLIVSDDIEYCKIVLFKNKPNFIFSNDADYIQLYLQTYCKNNIIANSTFHWWGAYMNQNQNKKVIYPTNWFGPDGKNQDTKDLFPNDWIGINTI